MKNNFSNSIKIGLSLLLAVFALNFSRGQNSGELTIDPTISVMGQVRPIPVSLEGFSGEVADVLKFDLYVQGFSFVTPDAAQYKISGSSAANVQGYVTDVISRQTKFSRSYTGASLRREAHAFADDIVSAITGKPGIAQLRGSTARIAFKAQAPGGSGEIYVSDFDGHNAQAVTHDNSIVAAPAWVPGRLALYYTSYEPGNPDIFYHNLSTGERRVVSKFSGLNTSAAVSPDGSKIAMILSRSGSPNVWVCNADGSGLMKLSGSEEDSSPCWSPDGKWICFATKIRDRRVLAKVPAGGGAVQRISTAGVSNPTDPDWSPDNKWIAFTSQMGDFNICVVPAGGGTPTVLVAGEHPSWSPNSRTLICARRTAGSRYTLSVLDAMTKQVKDIGRISGNDSEPAWAK
jgi:TolB protein